MIYTSYIARLKDLPEDDTKILVTRYKPKGITLSDTLLWAKELAPSYELLKDWKDGKLSWEDYANRYLDEKFEDDKFMTSIVSLIALDQDEHDTYLLCYEKDDTNCHRSLLRLILEENGVECKEYIPPERRN